MLNKKVVLAAALLMLPLLLTPVRTIRAQDQDQGQEMNSREAIALQNQILELKAEIETLKNQPPPAQPMPAAMPADQPSSAAVPPANGDVAAQLVVRVSDLEDKVRQLQGKVDDLTNQLQHDHDDLTKQIGDINFKLDPNAVPDGGTAPATVAAPPNSPPPAPEVKPTTETLLKTGTAAWLSHDFAGAVAAATEALQNGAGAHTTDAELLLARGKAGQKNWKEAATAYFSVYKRAPKGPDAPLALLGVANALIGLGKNHDACGALSKLGAEYPHALDSIKIAAKADRRKAACN
jgi:TolA-binding protein